MEKIKQTIVKARRDKGFTQLQVADLLGIGLRMYQKIEGGEFPKYKREQIKQLDYILSTSVYEQIYEQNGATKDDEETPIYEPKPEFTVDMLAYNLATTREVVNMMSEVYKKPVEEMEAKLKERAALKKAELIRVLSF